MYYYDDQLRLLAGKDSAVLADLILQSHHVMVTVRRAVYPCLYLLKYGQEKIDLLRYETSFISELFKDIYTLPLCIPFNRQK